MKVKVKITCPYCGHNQHIDQDSTIFYGTIKKLTECPAVKCGLAYVYDLDMEITVVAWAIEGQTFLRDNKKLPAMDPKVLEYLDPAKKVPADQTKPRHKITEADILADQVELKPVKMAIKAPVVLALDVLAWITTNPNKGKYSAGWISSDIYRYCKHAKTAFLARAAMDALEKLGNVVKIDKKMKSCRDNAGGSFGYRLAIEKKEGSQETSKANGSEQEPHPDVDGNKIPDHYNISQRPGRLKTWPSSTNHIQSTPKE